MKWYDLVHMIIVDLLLPATLFVVLSANLDRMIFLIFTLPVITILFFLFIYRMSKYV